MYHLFTISIKDKTSLSVMFFPTNQPISYKGSMFLFCLYNLLSTGCMDYPFFQIWTVI